MSVASWSGFDEVIKTPGKTAHPERHSTAILHTLETMCLFFKYQAYTQ